MTEILLALELEARALVYCALAIFAGAYLKGYTGFGASMFWVTSLSLMLPPLKVVPMVLLFEVVTSIVLLPQIWKDIRWNSILALLFGTWIATPIGIYSLSILPADPIRIGLAIIVFSAAILILRGFALKHEPGHAKTVGVGLMAGVLNGSMGIVGPPVILFYFSSPIGVVAGRASIVAFFIGTDSVGSVMFASQGLISDEVLWRTLAFIPILVLGVTLGNQRFLNTDAETFKRMALYVLMGLSFALAIRAVV